MKVLVVGSRGIDDIDISRYIPEETSLIISGGAKGVDSLAEAFADANKISKLILRPDYSKYGRAAPLKRNEIMVDIADLTVVIWNGTSRGSKYTIDYAKKKGKLVKVILQSD